MLLLIIYLRKFLYSLSSLYTPNTDYMHTFFNYFCIVVSSSVSSDDINILRIKQALKPKFLLLMLLVVTKTIFKEPWVSLLLLLRVDLSFFIAPVVLFIIMRLSCRTSKNDKRYLHQYFYASAFTSFLLEVGNMYSNPFWQYLPSSNF